MQLAHDYPRLAVLPPKPKGWSLRAKFFAYGTGVAFAMLTISSVIMFEVVRLAFFVSFILLVRLKLHC